MFLITITHDALVSDERLPLITTYLRRKMIENNNKPTLFIANCAVNYRSLTRFRCEDLQSSDEIWRVTKTVINAPMFRAKIYIFFTF